MSDQWTMAFDNPSLRAIRKLQGFEAFLEPELESAMLQIVTDLQGYAQAFMWSNFQNPTGPLEDAVETDVPNPYTGIVFNASPYAWRREEGFSGMTDSLGRFYANDPGIAFFATTLQDNKAHIKAVLRAAVNTSLNTMVGP